MSDDPRENSISLEELLVNERHSVNATRAYRLNRFAAPFFAVLVFGDLGGQWTLPLWVHALGYSFCAATLVAQFYFSSSRSSDQRRSRDADALNVADAVEESPTEEKKNPSPVSQKYVFPITFTCEPREDKSPYIDKNYDNPRLMVSGESLERLKVAMSLCISDGARGYYKDESQFVLFRWEAENMTPFPEEVCLERCAEIAMAWLKGAAKYPEEPNIEGSSRRGWICYTQRGGHIDGFAYPAFLAVKPYWLLVLK